MLGAVLSVLLLIIVGRLLIDLLSDAIEGDFPVDVILPLLALGSLESIILLAPVALLLALMLTLGRLYRDNEMTVLRACGVGAARLYRPLVWLTLPVVIVLSLLVFYVSPWAVRLAGEIAFDAEHRADLSMVSAGRFITAEDQAQWVLFVEDVNHETGMVENIFIHSLDRGAVTIETAERADQIVDPETGARLLVLSDGYRYEGTPGQGDYIITAFERHTLRLPQLAGQPAVDEPDAKPTAALLASDDSADRAELQFRLSVPVSAALLALLAIPLSHTTPRQGRFAKLALAIVIYILYANAVLMAVNWVERGLLPAWIGVWWAHGLLLAFIGLLFIHRYGWRWSLRRLAPRPA